MLTKQQARWASKHDWYIHSEEIINSGYAQYVVHVRSDEGGEPIHFSNFQELKDYAGY